MQQTASVPDAAAEHRAWLDRIDETLMGVEPAEAQTMQLFYFHRRTFAQIALETRSDEADVRRRLARGLRAFGHAYLLRETAEPA